MKTVLFNKLAGSRTATDERRLLRFHAYSQQSEAAECVSLLLYRNEVSSSAAGSRMVVLVLGGHVDGIL